MLSRFSRTLCRHRYSPLNLNRSPLRSNSNPHTHRQRQTAFFPPPTQNNATTSPNLSPLWSFKLLPRILNHPIKWGITKMLFWGGGVGPPHLPPGTPTPPRTRARHTAARAPTSLFSYYRLYQEAGLHFRSVASSKKKAENPAISTGQRGQLHDWEAYGKGARAERATKKFELEIFAKKKPIR